MTIIQYDNYKKELRQKAKGISSPIKRNGLTDEGRKKLSEALKIRWQNDEYRTKYTSSRGRNVTLETRQKISNAIKLKWESTEYRQKCTSTIISDEQRQKISDTLKKKWNEDIEFKNKMLNNLSYNRSPEWRASISEKIKEKWSDPVYRNKVGQNYDPSCVICIHPILVLYIYSYPSLILHTILYTVLYTYR